MEEKQCNREDEKQRRREAFSAGFFAGLALLGGLALILLALFWLL